MGQLTTEEICAYVNDNIVEFHNRRIAIITKLKLQKLIAKNPYLFKAKNINRASELIEGTLDAFLSSSEEKIFGDFLEGLALFIVERTKNGRKSTSTGIDIEFNEDGAYTVISVKSGINWGNSSQHARLETDFQNAERRLRQSAHVKSVQKILGICYGKTKTRFNRGYYTIVGQNFWTLISNNKYLYIDIIEPVGYEAKAHNERYSIERDRISNQLTKQFIDSFCHADGLINWEKLLMANSGNYDLDQSLHLDS